MTPGAQHVNMLVTMTGNQLRALKLDDPKRWRKIVLSTIEGRTRTEAASELGVSVEMIDRWLREVRRG